ncbi:hypothetical protein HaLaN_30914, partial [Haematococcus lacustris]
MSQQRGPAGQPCAAAGWGRSPACGAPHHHGGAASGGDHQAAGRQSWRDSVPCDGDCQEAGPAQCGHLLGRG